MTEATVPLGRGLAYVGLESWEVLGKPDTFEEWHKALGLTESYTIVKVDRTAPTMPIELLIAHKDIPVVTGERLPWLILLYTRRISVEGKSTTVFAGTQVTRWEGERYHTQEITE